MTSIDDVINSDLILLDLEASDAGGVIDKLAETFERDGRVTDRGAYVDAVLAREQETGGTGMESGVAIPHAKSPGVARAGFAFGRSAQGVDFGADDGTKADLIFLIAAPQGEDELHVKILSRLARRLIHDDFRESLRQAGSADEVMTVIREQVDL